MADKILTKLVKTSIKEIGSIFCKFKPTLSKQLPLLTANVPNLLS